jgi:lysophospholipase L1-like esterase
MLRLLAVSLVVLVSLVLGALAAEGVVRSGEGYRLLSWTLEKPNAGYGIYPGEIRYLYNRLFRDIPDAEIDGSGPGKFDPVARFGAETEYPRYMFKPDYRLALREGRFEPVGPDAEDLVWESNERGFRGESFPWREDDPEQLRVIAVGGSVTEGQVALEGTYPYQLEEVLEAILPGRDVEVLNAGFAGLGAPDMLALTRYELLSYAPDYVVYFDAGNGLKPFNSFDIEKPRGVSAWLYARSALWRGLLRRFELPIPGGSYTVERDRENPSLDTYLGQLGELVGLVREAGARFVLLGPVVGYGSGDWTEERVPAEVYWLHDWWKPIAPQDILDAHYRVTSEGMAAFAKRRDIPFLDLQREVGDDPENFYRFGQVLDLGHFSPQGNREIAIAVADYIRQDLAR